MNVIQFHIDHKCYVRIKPLNKEIGCIVSFPKNKLKDIKENTITYILDKNTYQIEVYSIHNVKPKIIQANKINIRLLVVEDIILKTFALDLNKDLIIVDDKKKLFEVLSINIDNEDLKKEQFLCKKFRSLLSGEVDDLEDVEGYQQLVNVFENGGF